MPAAWKLSLATRDCRARYPVFSVFGADHGRGDFQAEDGVRRCLRVLVLDGVDGAVLPSGE